MAPLIWNTSSGLPVLIDAAPGEWPARQPMAAARGRSAGLANPQELAAGTVPLRHPEKRTRAGGPGEARQRLSLSPGPVAQNPPASAVSYPPGCGRMGMQFPRLPLGMQCWGEALR